MPMLSRTLTGLLLCCLSTTFSYAEKPKESTNPLTAEEIVTKADSIRFPPEGFQVDVRITTQRPDEEDEVRAYRVLSKGNDRTLLMTVYPAVDKGNILLMKDRDLWAFMKNLSQPVRLPLSAKLTGEVSNGDIARANFRGDYNPTLMGIEEIDGERYYKIDLKAARRGVTYKKVVYWVAEDSFRPYKAEFYSVSNRLIKTCLYQDFIEMAGGERPSKLIMTDAKRARGVSVLDYQNMKQRKLPEKVFTKQYLKKLSG